MSFTLTYRQRRFVSELAQCGNATEAARRAGYSPATAKQIAYENLQKPSVRNAIDHELALAGLDNKRIAEALHDLLHSDKGADVFRAVKLILKIRGDI